MACVTWPRRPLNAPPGTNTLPLLFGSTLVNGGAHQVPNLANAGLGIGGKQLAAAFRKAQMHVVRALPLVSPIREIDLVRTLKEKLRLTVARGPELNPRNGPVMAALNPILPANSFFRGPLQILDSTEADVQIHAFWRLTVSYRAQYMANHPLGQTMDQFLLARPPWIRARQAVLDAIMVRTFPMLGQNPDPAGLTSTDAGVDWHLQTAPVAAIPPAVPPCLDWNVGMEPLYNNNDPRQKHGECSEAGPYVYYARVFRDLGVPSRTIPVHDGNSVQQIMSGISVYPPRMMGKRNQDPNPKFTIQNMKNLPRTVARNATGAPIPPLDTMQDPCHNCKGVLRLYRHDADAYNEYLGAVYRAPASNLAHITMEYPEGLAKSPVVWPLAI
ncbi:hypothetical protein MMC30_009391 [Trapelia coarctata]|nr:hypothetical protein [Trapelia coarctata]